MPEDEDQCGLGEEDHAFFFKAEYELTDGEDGESSIAVAAVSTHLHSVPPDAAIKTMVLTALTLLADHMAQDIYESFPHMDVAHAMASLGAKKYLISVIESMPEDMGMFSANVPDDISELLKGD